ncbi:MAG TPA: translation initiation factor IF-2 [Drouetiella sp.]|jgi:translation initiation factor IF-2
MNDRVRVYELARQMNIPNEDVITTLRELGHDIKSHSSTVDKVAVGQLISALNKKKQQPEKTDTKAKGVKAPPAPGTSKAATKTPVPPPPVVKPRVLARYRRPDAAGAEAPLQEVEITPAASIAAVAAPPEIEEEQPVVSEPTNGQQPPAAVEPAAATNGAQAAQTPPTVAPTPAPQEAPAAAPVATEAEKPESEPVQPAASTATEEKETQKGDKAEPKVEQNDNDTDSFMPPFSGQAVKPMAPSVPVRIAAPSVRATPPRPPKAHRQSPSERHAQKKDDRSRPAAVAPVEVPRIITLTNSLTVKELAEKMNVPDTEVIKRLFMRGFPRTVNQTVEYELAKDLAVEMEYEVLSEDLEALTAPDPVEPELSPEEQASLVLRPPVVTIMGHVDHGKTSLLDAIRQTKFLLTDSEAGGITQHIGAYHVEVESEDGSMRQIVFLDTPGHEAFTAMRARGAKATDIAILVVAADDGVMPQTIEAIDHAKAAGVPIIVAVNKIDKADAEPDRVLSQLMEHGLLPDKYGGETVTVNVSAKKRTGLDELLEMILLVADIQDLKANPDKPATGVIIEAELSRGKGAVATALVENGTLREGDYLVAGSKSGRVRALFDDRGQRVKAAGPSMPVSVLGLDEVPQAGDRFEVVSDVHASKILIEQRKLGQVERKAHHVSLESLHEMLTKGEVKDLNVIVKADVQGTAEAIAEQVKKLSGNEVAVRVLRTASGDISENDVNLAASSEAIIIGFNVNPDQNARQVAEAAGVDIRTYNIIYQITDDLEKAIQGLIQPVRKEVKIGVAEVRQIFKFGKQLMIGGCMVIEGKVQRGCIAKIERNGTIVHEGKLDTLKRFKDDVKEVAQGFECGMSFEKFSDLQEGDKINAYVIQESKGEITR